MKYLIALGLALFPVSALAQSLPPSVLIRNAKISYHLGRGTGALACKYALIDKGADKTTVLRMALRQVAQEEVTPGLLQALGELPENHPSAQANFEGMYAVIQQYCPELMSRP
jgi:hypothetical protein